MSDQPEPRRFDSIASLLLRRAASTPDGEAFSYPDEEDVRQSLTWRQLTDRVRAVAMGLRELGIEDEQRVAILSTTRIEWIVADLGTLCAGAATTTIYPSSPAEDCAFVLSDSGARLVFVEDGDQLAKLRSIRDQIPEVAHAICITEDPGDDGWALPLAEIERRGRERLRTAPEAFDATVERIRPHHLATLIYTSGTTGRPKGVEIPHDSWLYTGEALETLQLVRPDDRQLLWLPLSHSFGKVLVVAALQLGFPTHVDGRIPRLVDNLSTVKPTFMAAAPRIFEKIYNKIVTDVRFAGSIKYNLFAWSLDVGREVSTRRQQGQAVDPWLAWRYAVADRLVFSKIRRRFGGRLRLLISGSAPLSKEMAEFFHAAGILICEGYGLTESSAASVVNLPGRFRFGTVGKPLPGTEVRFGDDGEILLKSRGVMRGYLGLRQETAATLRDGWLHTGDIGELDDDGFLKITDRKKNLIKTSGGKYVAPQAIEASLKARCPYLSQVLVHGDRRNFCTALVTLDPEALGKWAREEGLDHLSQAELTDHDAVVGMVQEAIDETNAHLARHESLKRFAILPEDFSVDNGLLTPSLKVRRKVVEDRYASVLDAFYRGALEEV